MGRARADRSRQSVRWLGLLLAAGAAVISLYGAFPDTLDGIFGNTYASRMPIKATPAATPTPPSLGQRVVAIAEGQVGYSADPANSYCNKFSEHWDSGMADCPSGELDEEWCADFAAWAWQQAGVPVAYGYEPGEINGAAVSFYEWGIANGKWHPVTSRYVAMPGDIAVYGLSLSPDADPLAQHVAIVTADAPGQRGPDVVNGDGDRTAFSIVEVGTDEVTAYAGHKYYSLSGYVSLP